MATAITYQSPSNSLIYSFSDDYFLPPPPTPGKNRFSRQNIPAFFPSNKSILRYDDAQTVERNFAQNLSLALMNLSSSISTIESHPQDDGDDAYQNDDEADGNRTNQGKDVIQVSLDRIPPLPFPCLKPRQTSVKTTSKVQQGNTTTFQGMLRQKMNTARTLRRSLNARGA
ncbi:hypothetical protein ACHAW6_012715 [Cyclotella cf. meneghiniana]